MTWWCSATGLPWTGEWRWYPGVWLFILVLLVAYLRFGRVGGKGRSPDLLFGIGLLLVWAALDWPLGALGGYLASAHAGQFILLSLAAPPFLLLGLRPRLAQGRTVGWLRVAAHPATGLIGYNLVMMVTHIPGVVDQLMPTQGGSFAIDLLWLLAGGLLWWPVCAPATYRRISPPLQMGYLFLQTIPGILPAAFLVFSSYPLYRLYELAPRVTAALPPGYDHQVAGLLMKVVGDPLIWIGIAVIFFRWAHAERRADIVRGPSLHSRMVQDRGSDS